jgi:CRP/FNR family transcriptional regulator, cyclic AMP receptor protein
VGTAEIDARVGTLVLHARRKVESWPDGRGLLGRMRAMGSPTPAELQAIPLFKSLSSTELEEIAGLFTVRSYPKGAVVATEGDRLELFNVILSGRIQFFWRSDDGQQVKLGIDGPGGHYADVTLFAEPILMSVIALDDLRVASVPIAALKELLLRHPGVGLSLLADVVARLRRLVQRTRAFTMEDVYGRVVKLLLASAAESEGKHDALRLTHIEIGQRVGATREMVGRILRDLAQGGYIKVARGRITVLRTPPARR